ncbi:DEAD/DEAH box helicase [Xanthomarina gelatinilytica]|uniref:DEAD/DEAH box helicase n=1 Tax=Xanthomarina gelatinilytica TaxID=1137281 RepID=UPI003AA93CE2
MVDIKKGQTDKNATSELLIKFFKKLDTYSGKLYIGYPILYAGGENIIVDALWISESKGVVIFDLIEGREFSDRKNIRDALYNKVESELKQYEELNSGRILLVEIEAITYAPACKFISDIDYTAFNEEQLNNIIDNIPNWTSASIEIFRKTLSVIQSVIKIKTAIDRSYILKENSKGAIIKRLEQTIANLDNQQEEAIIEYHDGLQRIRGLAGSGKTIVLALKAAYLHATNPDWNIAVTFNTRALKNQFQELIELFCIQKMGKKPNEDRIEILQAWGGSQSTGIYYEFCKNNGIEYLDFRAARALASQKGIEPFDAACQKALESINKSKIIPIYDAILVDEAQDLSESFLNLCYIQLTKKKRLIYAYDELQKLNEGSSLRNPNKIFGSDASDIILKKCYRNSRPVLVSAHAFGFGIYRKGGLVQFFDQPELWGDLGYLVKSGELKGGKQVTLTRTEEATHKFLEQEIEIDEIIKFKTFESKQAQANAIADDIEKNLKNEELLHRDIMIINPLALTTKKEVALVRALLDARGIKSHIAGDVDKDEFFRSKSIAFTGINRAKGNEVPFVYIMNGHDCYSHPFSPNWGIRERRNILFTAITRSKAWVRVFGVGSNMKLLEEEFEIIKKNNFELNFKYPTQEEIDRMNVISRDITVTEEIQLKSDIDSLSTITDIVQRIKSGENLIEDYPEEMQGMLRLLIK